MIGIQAVRYAVIERWSNGQTEGQINRLNSLKRAMFGRADTELIMARLLPIGEIADHRSCG
jgi:transposase